MRIQDKVVSLILAKFDTGAGKKGAADGPENLLKALSKSNIIFDDVQRLENESSHSHSAHPFCKNIDILASNSQHLCQMVYDTVNQNKLPIIFSGDHSNAIGGLSGLKCAYPEKRIGVIWIDAHADLHSPYTTPSGNMHGMPLAVLLALDNLSHAKNPISETEKSAWDALKSIGPNAVMPKISAQDLVFIGLRDAEKEEWGLIDELNIKFFEPEDIKEHGIYYVINHSLEHLNHCDLLYISFDVDSMDPNLADGTGTPVDNGLTRIEAESVVKTLLNHPKTAAFEITEINPSLDTKAQKMADLTAEIVSMALKK
ncbi:MAG: arginase [Bacteroidia bacterium]|nr:arginase [Bacteroidia bacterium]